MNTLTTDFTGISRVLLYIFVPSALEEGKSFHQENYMGFHNKVLYLLILKNVLRFW